MPPLTRSTSRPSLSEPTLPVQSPRKRKAAVEDGEGTASKPRSASKRAKKTTASSLSGLKAQNVDDKDTGARPSPALSASIPRIHIDVDPDSNVIPGQLTFSYEDAKAHLIAADNRFVTMFEHVKCAPFESVEAMDPFKFVLR